MKTLIIPLLFRRSGIKIKCTKCTRQLGDGLCYSDPNNPTSLSKCKSKDSHKYILIICVPNSKRRIMKIIETRDFTEALIEMNAFKKELIATNYQKPLKVKMIEVKNTLIELCMQYLDWQSGINVPAHLVRHRSKDTISDCKRTLLRFCEALKQMGYNLDMFEIQEVGNKEVGIFHEYLYEKFKPSKSTYNRQFRVMKAFINYVVKFSKIQMDNPFELVELNTVIKVKEIITKEEFSKLLNVVTYENGQVSNCRKGDKTNLYHDWLKLGFKLSLETGLRREEVVRLKWSDLVEISTNKYIFSINNLKVNRILHGTDEGSKLKSVPVTKSLMEVLIAIGFDDNKGLNKFVLDRPKELTDEYVMRHLSKAFGHYIKLVTDSPLQLKCLRKTYITHLVMKLGPSARLFTGHSDDKVLESHYLSSAFLAGNLSDFKLF